MIDAFEQVITLGCPCSWASSIVLGVEKVVA